MNFVLPSGFGGRHNLAALHVEEKSFLVEAVHSEEAGTYIMYDTWSQSPLILETV